jgi:hypothetical protein
MINMSDTPLPQERGKKSFFKPPYFYNRAFPLALRERGQRGEVAF